MKNIIAVDASYSRTGLALFKEDGSVRHKSITRSGNNYKIDQCLTHATEIAKEAKDWILKYEPKGAVLIYEYPAMASRSGAILAVLMAKFDSMFKVLLKRGYVSRILYVPPVAVSAYTGIKFTDKTAVVEFSKSIVADGRYNHDVATAIILAKICQEIVDGTYKKSVYEVKL